MKRVVLFILFLRCSVIAMDSTGENSSPDRKKEIASEDEIYYIINKNSGAHFGKIVDANDVTYLDASWNPTSDRVIVVLGHHHWCELAAYSVTDGKVTRYKFKEPDMFILLSKSELKKHSDFRKISKDVTIVGWPTPKTAKIQVDVGITGWNKQNDLCSLSTIYEVEFTKDSVRSHSSEVKISKVE